MREHLSPGDEFAGYRLERELGRGGMGVVYLAEQIALGRWVALKVVTPQFAGDPGFRARFEREARHAASIDHRNVVPIYAADTSEGLLYLAMRYIEGTDLRAELSNRGVFDAGLAGHIANEIGKALDAAHANGLVHRDVKPANVLLAGGDELPDVYLTDFGLTKDASSESGGLTNTGQWVGTLNYVAPEQLGGKAIDARSDVYSLGCVLFEMLAGRLPYEGPEAQKMWGHAHEPVPSLAPTDPRLGERFDPVVARAMAKDPDERYPSAGDFGRACLASAKGKAITEPERSVATGAAAVGLALGDSPTGTAATHPLPRPRARREPPPPPVAHVDEARTRTAPTRPRHWIAAVAAIVLLAAGAGTALLLAGGSPQTAEAPSTREADRKRVPRTVTVEKTTQAPRPKPETEAPAAQPAPPTVTTPPSTPPQSQPGVAPTAAFFSVVIASEPSRAAADTAASRARSAGLTGVGVLNSDDYSSLTPGLWVAYVGTFGSLAEAQQLAPSVRGSGFTDAYTRQISP